MAESRFEVGPYSTIYPCKLADGQEPVKDGEGVEGRRLGSEASIIQLNKSRNTALPLAGGEVHGDHGEHRSET